MRSVLGKRAKSSYEQVKTDHVEWCGNLTAETLNFNVVIPESTKFMRKAILFLEMSKNEVSPNTIDRIINSIQELIPEDEG